MTSTRSIETPQRHEHDSERSLRQLMPLANAVRRSAEQHKFGVALLAEEFGLPSSEIKMLLDLDCQPVTKRSYHAGHKRSSRGRR